MYYLSSQSIPIQEIAMKKCIIQYWYIPVSCFCVLYDCENCGLLWRSTSQCDIPPWHSRCTDHLCATAQPSIDEFLWLGSLPPEFVNRARWKVMQKLLHVYLKNVPLRSQNRLLLLLECHLSGKGHAAFSPLYQWNSTFLPTFHRAFCSGHKMLFHQVLINGLFGSWLGTYGRDLLKKPGSTWFNSDQAHIVDWSMT